MKRLGLFGGSFDPVHRGHLALAHACREQAALDAIWFIPTAVQPLKPWGPVASNEDRLAMLRLALDSEPHFELCPYEIEQGGTSYTVDTLGWVAEQMPDAERYLLMGADTLRDFAAWSQPAEVLRLATPLVVQRAGEAAIDWTVLQPYTTIERCQQIAQAAVELPPIEISSSGLRDRLANSDSCDAELPPGVAQWIAERGLYQ